MSLKEKQLNYTQTQLVCKSITFEYRNKVMFFLDSKKNCCSQKIQEKLQKLEKENTILVSISNYLTTSPAPTVPCPLLPPTLRYSRQFLFGSTLDLDKGAFLWYNYYSI